MLCLDLVQFFKLEKLVLFLFKLLATSTFYMVLQIHGSYILAESNKEENVDNQSVHVSLQSVFYCAKSLSCHIFWHINFDGY